MGRAVRARKRARSASLADALFPRTRQRVLGLLFGQPDRTFSKSELIRLAASGVGSVQREIDRLVGSGLVAWTTDRGQKRYQADHTAAIFEEVRGIVEKTGGVAEVLRSALSPVAVRIQLAILYGSVAKQSDRATSDIDVLIVSDELPLEDLYRVLQPAERRLGRVVSPTVYTRQEFLRRRRDGSAFVGKVMAGKHVVLIGNEDAVTAR